MPKRKYIVKREKGVDEHFKLVPATWYESVALCLCRLELKNSKMRSGETPIFTIAKSKYDCLEEEILKGLDTLNEEFEHPMKAEAIKYCHGYYDNHGYSLEEIREKLGYDDVSIVAIPAWRDITEPCYSISWYYDLHGIEKPILKSMDFKKVIYREILAMLFGKSKDCTFLAPILNRYEISISSKGEYTNDIRDLELTVRAFNCLYRSGVTTIVQLLLMSELELRGVRNLGKKQIEEVLEIQKKILYKDSEPFVVQVRHKNQESAYTFEDATGLEIAQEVYEVIVNEILQAANETVFDYPMPSGLEDYLLLKGYLLINDVLEDSERIQNELQTIGLNECADYLSALTKAISEYQKQKEAFRKDSQIEILELAEFSKDKLIEYSEDGRCLIGRLRAFIEADNEYLEKCKGECMADANLSEFMMCDMLLRENKEELYTLSVFSDKNDYILIETEESMK